MIDLLPGINVSETVTALGDSTLLLPLSAAVAVVLWVRRSAALALAWAAPLALSLGGLAALKVFGYACGLEVLGTLVVSPSGHAAFGAAFYGTVGMMAARRLDGWRGAAVLLAALAVVAAVAVSRVKLSAHSVPEVLIGVTVGTAAVLLSAWAQARVAVPQGARPAPALAGSAAAVVMLAVPLLVLVAGGYRLPVEDRIRDVAGRLRASMAICTAAQAPSGALFADRKEPRELDIPEHLH